MRDRISNQVFQIVTYFLKTLIQILGKRLLGYFVIMRSKLLNWEETNIAREDFIHFERFGVLWECFRLTAFSNAQIQSSLNNFIKAQRLVKEIRGIHSFPVCR